MNYNVIVDGWCLAKLMLLFGGDLGPLADIDVVEKCFKLARLLAECVDEGERVIKVSSFEEEMQSMDMPQALKSLLRYLFIVDADKRPSAAQALASHELRAFEAEGGSCFCLRSTTRRQRTSLEELDPYVRDGDL